MEITSEIININEVTMVVTIKYTLVDINESLIYNINIPIIDGEYADLEYLLNLVEQQKPIAQFKSIMDLKNVEKPHYINDFKLNITNDDSYIENNKLEVKARLQETDWTQLSDSPLTKLEKDAYKQYRKNLRLIDVKLKPEDIVYPASPTSEYR
jgi:hypothetical protein